MTTRCFIRQSILEAMRLEADRLAPRETGGIVLGASTQGYIWIDQIIGPGPGATHEMSMFIPDHDYQEHAVSLAYEASGRRLKYLGDWHTHPSGPRSLSQLDVRTLRAIAGSSSARQSAPVMILLAGEHPWHLGAWRIHRRRWRPGWSIQELEITIT
jgi:integrative and conjugative element protein (TIGR02256 family)